MTPGPGRFHHPLINDSKALKYCSGFDRGFFDAIIRARMQPHI